MGDMTIFSTYITENKELNSKVLMEKQLKSTVFPECASIEELLIVGEKLRVGQCHVWCYYYGSPPHIHEFGFFEDCMRVVRNEYMTNVLLYLSNENAFFWLPEEHEYFVVFGDTGTLGKIENSEIFTYQFDDYLNEGIMSDGTRSFLRKMLAKYSVTWRCCKIRN